MTINGSKNPALRGTPITIFATGLGVLAVPLGDSLSAPSAAISSKDPIGVLIGGQASVVTYAGSSPGSIGGLTQINAIIPSTVPTGQVTLTVTGGDASSARQSPTPE